MFTIKESLKKVNKMSLIKVTGLLILLICILCGTVLSQNGIIVNLKIAENPWADSQLKDKLDLRLSTISKVSIVRADTDATLNKGPLQTSHLDDLIEHGQIHNDVTISFIPTTDGCTDFENALFSSHHEAEWVDSSGS